jgi:hypothetical protein
MFGKPSLAHRAKLGGVDTTGDTHSGEQNDRDQHDEEADEERHALPPHSVIRA